MTLSKTGAGLAKWARDIIAGGKHVYWYGTYCNPCTVDRLEGKTNQYPDHYTSRRRETYEKHIAQGKICTDCVGLIKGYLWEKDGAIKYQRDGIPDKGAYGMYSAAKIKDKIATLPEIPGALVWTSSKGHIAVYIGGGYVIEARGFSYGVQKNKLSDRNFTHWGLCPYTEYTAEEIATAQKAAGTTAKQPTATSKPTTGAQATDTPTLRKGDKGDAVKRMQELLKKAGCKLEKYGADGHFGAETLEALKAYQTAHNLTVDGICGPLTWKSLISDKKAAEGQETPDTSTERPTLRKGSKGDAVKEMQTLLVNAGCRLPLHGIDGKCGSETVEAIKAYQTTHGLTADGICGRKTWAALLKV